MRNIKLTIEYLGTNYYGWQILPGKATVQGEVVKVLEKILSHPVKLTGASRTDAGVHALGQVANFFTEKEIPTYKLKRALNGLLPPDIKVKEVEEVPPEFNARFSARGKEYLYRIFNREVPSPFEYKRSWFIPFKLNVQAMEKAASHFVGEKDFSSFSKKERKKKINPVRKVTGVEIKKEEEVIEIKVTGESFLRHMVRIMVATLVEVGRGKLTPDGVKEILERKDRRFAPYLAPPEGLYLVKVFY